MGGVMIPSKVPAPIIAGYTGFLPYLFTKAYSEKTPPSPWLSACNVMITYLKVVCRVNVQKMHEIAPNTNSLFTLPPSARIV